MRYWGPFNSPGGIYGNDGYVDGSKALGIEGSIPTFRTFEQMMRELQNLVVKSGLVPDDVMNGIQVAQAVQKGKVMYGADIGTKNTMTIALDPVPTGYTAGLKILVLKNPAVAANDGPLTINVNGMGVRDVKQPDGIAPIRSGYCLPGALLLLAYDGVSFQLLAGGGGAPPDQFFDLDVKIFNATALYTIPPGVRNFQLEAWAGGGGGGGGNGSEGGGGGGGGEYGFMYCRAAPGATINILIGNGGLGTNGFAGTGQNGASTSISIQGGATFMTLGGGGAGLPPGSQGAGPGQGGSINLALGAGFTQQGSGGFTPSSPPGWGGSPGGTVAKLGRGYSMQGNSGLSPGGGGSGNASSNFYTPAQISGAPGRCIITHIRSS